MGNQNAVTETITRFERLTRGTCFAPRPGEVVDDITNLQRGYWFGEALPVEEAKRRLIYCIAQNVKGLIDPSLPPGEDAGSRLNIPTARVLLREIDEIMETVYVLVHIVSRGKWPGKQPETELRVNTNQRMRNLFWTPEGCVLASIIPETAFGGNKDLTVLPHHVSSLLYQTQAGGLHHLRLALAGAVYGPEVAQNYHS